MTDSHLTTVASIFAPQSVAVVGASTRPDKLGAIVVRNLRQAGFAGPIYPVNPKVTTLAGLPCYPSLAAIPGPVDQVSICIPAAGVLEVIQQAIAKGVHSIVIMAAGFGETATGRASEQEIARLCSENNIQLIGPNTIGLLSPTHHFNNSWLASLPPAGPIAIASQSGALGAALLDVSREYHLGWRYFCSLGNKAGVDELELIRAWQADDQVQVIGLYLEDIAHGQQFVHELALTADTKPIVVLTAGRTSASQEATTTHTGSLTSPYAFTTAALRQAGCLEVTSFRDFCLSLQALATPQVTPATGRVAIVTNAGGAGILAIDELLEAGLSLAELDEATRTQLTTALPASAAVGRLIDVLGDAPAARYDQVYSIIGQNSEVDIIFTIVTPQAMTQPTEIAATLRQAHDRYPDKLFISCFLGGETMRPAIDSLTQVGQLAYSDLTAAVQLAALLHRRGFFLHRFHHTQVQRQYRWLTPRQPGRYHALIDALLTQQGASLLEDRVAQLLLSEVGLELPAQATVHTLREAIEFAGPHFPVVLKASANLIAHRTDQHAVYPNLRTQAELGEAFVALHQLITNLPHHHRPTFLIQQMIDAKAEFFIGAERQGPVNIYQAGDQVAGFGHLLTFGQGGIYTEVWRDLASVLVPAGRREIKNAYWSTKFNQIAMGERGQSRLPEALIIDAIKAVQTLVTLYPEIKSLDINPLLVTTEQAVVVDAKILISP